MKTCGIYFLFLLSVVPVQAAAINIALGSADSFAVLGGAAVTNSGPSTINGNVGSGGSIMGFPPGVQIAPSAQAFSDLMTAYNFAAGEACGVTLTGQDLGGLTLTPGVYCFSSTAQLTGTLTLNALGDPDAVFLFQIVSSLTTASDSSVLSTSKNVFWQVGSSATLGTGTAFYGNILALTSITLNTGATIPCGRALARNGAVTLDTNTISVGTPGCELSAGSGVPEPGTMGLLVAGVLAAGLQRFRRRGI